MNYLYRFFVIAAVLASLAGCPSGGSSGGSGTASSYTIGGSVSGLNGTVVLQNNNADNLTVSANGTFTFSTQVASGSPYSVSVLTQPASQVCTVTNASGSANGNVSNIQVTCVIVSLSAVSSLFSTNGANWNDYVKNDGVSIVASTGAACDPAVDGNGYKACLHGGEMRMVEMTGVASCSGLVAEDSLGAFDWVCNENNGIVRFVSIGLKDGKFLSDLIDFDTPAWKANSIRVSGSVSAMSVSSVWWSNPFVVDNNGMTAGEMNAAGTIYLVNGSTAIGNYEIGADRASLVIKPGVVLQGLGIDNRVVSANGRNFIWIEGRVNASGDSSAIYLGSVKFSVLRGVYGNHATSFGFWIGSSDNNNLSYLYGNNSGGTGMSLNGSSSNSINHVFVANHPSAGLTLANASNGNFIKNVIATNSSSGVYLYASTNNSFSRLNASNNNFGIMVDSSANNIFVDVTASHGSNYGVTLLTSTNNVLAGVTATNNGSSGVYLTSNSSNNTISVVNAVNNVSGLNLYSSSTSVISDVAVADNLYGLYLDTTSNNTFTGMLKVGNGYNCRVTGGTDPGLVDGTCENNGTSNATLTSGITEVSSFVGKVLTGDIVNTSDTDGAASYPASPSTFDWMSFENSYRTWGVDGSTFPNADNRGWWTTGAGRIWDWSLQAADTVVRAVLALPTGNDTLTHTWSDLTTSTFLRRAVEIQGDGIGNDNALCESNETCLYTPNIGSYQGHGNLVSAGAFTDGTLTGITLLKYETNGR